MFNKTRKSIPVDLRTVSVRLAKRVLILFKEQEAVCTAMLCTRDAKGHTPQRLLPGVQKVREDTLIHPSLDVHRSLPGTRVYR